MGLSQRKSGATYVHQFGDTLRVRVPAPTETSKTRKNKHDKEVHEEIHNCLDGWLVGVDYKKTELGVEFIVKIHDGDDLFIMSLGFFKGAGKDLMNRLNNADLSRKLEFKPWQKEHPKIPNQMINFMLVNYAGGTNDKVGRYSSREEPNGIPGPTKVMQDGQERLDFTDHCKALYKRLVKKAEMECRDEAEIALLEAPAQVPEHARVDKQKPAAAAAPAPEPDPMADLSDSAPAQSAPAEDPLLDPEDDDLPF